MTQPSQNAIARALGISAAAVTKCKKQGMPVDSIEAAARWRADNLNPCQTKGNCFDARLAAPSGALEHALALLAVADAALGAGQSVDALVPVLRAALHCVPEHERDPDMVLPSAVLELLIADVLALLPPRGALNDDGSPAWRDGSTMSDAEAGAMGRFWYEVAAGEWAVA